MTEQAETGAPRGKTVALVANTAWFLFNFRRELMKALQVDGWNVVAVAPEDGYGARIAAAGMRFIPFPLSRTGTNPLAEARSILALRRVLRSEGISAVLSFTPKGNIYSGLAACGLSIRRIATISGLGRVFVSRSALRLLVSALYRAVLSGASCVLFENDEDMRFFLAHGIVAPAKVERIPGLGVDLDRFTPLALAGDTPATFLMMARMLREKGVYEFVEAAREVKKDHPDARFCLLGPLESGHSSAVSEAQMIAWSREGVVQYLGMTDDVRPLVGAADCVVLPSSYGEGVPRSLMEAAAMQRPILTTDRPGCRDAVDDGVSGFLCRPGNSASLAAAMRRVLALDPAARVEMGRAGRAKMEREFDERLVIARYLDRLCRIAG